MINCQKELFDIPEGITYLNAAYMGPLMKETARIGKQAVEQKLNPWNISIDDFFDPSNEAYALFADLIDAQSMEIAIVPSVSYGTAIAAKNIKINKKQKIVVLADQFPSNIYPWKELAKKHGAIVQTLPWPDDNDWTRAILGAIDETTAIVACCQAHWTNGTCIDLVAVGEKAKKVGAALVLDLTQTLGVMPFSVKDVDPDFMVAGAYKWLLGPYSLGFMYAAPRHHGGEPIEQSWITRKDAHDFARLVDYKDEYEPGARRFDMGEKSNFIHLPMAVSALKKINGLGVDNIAAYLKTLTDDIANRSEAIGLDVARAGYRAPNLIGINFKNGVPGHIGPALAEKKIFISIRGDSIRVAPHIYNDTADVDRLFDVLEKNL